MEKEASEQQRAEAEAAEKERRAEEEEAGRQATAMAEAEARRQAAAEAERRRAEAEAEAVARAEQQRPWEEEQRRSREEERRLAEQQAAEEQARREARAKEDDEMVSEYLLSHGFKGGVNEKKKSLLKYQYPLHVAVKEQNPDMVKLLVERGADKSLKNSSGRTATDKAEEYSKKKKGDGTSTSVVHALGGC